MIAFIIIDLIILLGIIGYLLFRRMNKKEFIVSNSSSEEKILSIIHSEEFQKEINAIPAPTYELFKENAIEYLMSEIKKNRLHISEDSIRNNIEIDNELKTLFIKDLDAIIKEAENIETEAIAYHKTFGEEPPSDPELHPKDPNSRSIADQEIEEKSLDELMSIGTVEDIP